MSDKPLFLITNDDGIHAPGLDALNRSLSQIAEVMVVAPSIERSAVGHAITISEPLRVWEYEKNGEFFGYAVNGTPADCVKIAYWVIMDRKPDAVISGINQGSNTGINTIYSGTVSAATEGAILGLPSFAISLANWYHPEFEYAGKFAKQLAQKLLQNKLPEGVYLNVNIPNCKEEEIQGVSITSQGQALYHETFHSRKDPHGRTYYWLDGEKTDKETDLNIDDGAIDAKYVSITPVHYDLTNYEQIQNLKSWNLQK